jgi:DMSO/TMAO reductase YedYZ molybdopterin-dependent catalytic subunit
MANRAFVGRRDRSGRGHLPPGQYDVGADFPVLSIEVTPDIDPARWTFTVDGSVATPTTWTWDEVHALLPSEYRGDIHCVTTWSKLDTRFSGVSLDLFLDVVRPAPEASHVLATSTGGYTTNLLLDDIRGGRSWIVWSHEDRPLPAEHGGPVRLLVPHLYFWKSAKWVERITLLDHDRAGFWEANGYHDRGDPWQEQRYQGD